ncbi:hypothetical protein [Streptomyces collinus]|uniref:Polysaccharide pyruvyl transferase domain-containing protein n=1 Tax=Streptomyces collinus (strain DSM 40733 / Tue 365) TaxID=1214242 RepID=S5UR46_STRC3|nr:hypothetical protein [Streptomyces collinus]AGS69543.1 hypothetical protein B446_13625 [Streptomyces collinus Tu 365]UJA08185.1 hypothetical protein HGI10_20930 [Streptomyces collinus]UJA16950.1 hypothetical protein HGI09_43180 [Streptomyces collinus]
MAAAARINAEFDAFVVPLANAFRPSFENALKRLTRLITRLRIPVVVLGVGAQTGVSHDPARLRQIARRCSCTAAPSTSASGCERYPNLRFVGQNLSDARQLHWRDLSDPNALVTAMPTHPDHPMYREDKVRVYVDPVTWIDELRPFDFSFGSRIHGNIAARLYEQADFGGLTGNHRERFDARRCSKAAPPSPCVKVFRSPFRSRNPTNRRGSAN